MAWPFSIRLNCCAGNPGGGCRCAVALRCMSNLSSCESSCDGPSCDADGCPSDCGRSTAVDQILSPPFDHKLPPQSPLASLFEVGNPSCSGRLLLLSPSLCG